MITPPDSTMRQPVRLRFIQAVIAFLVLPGTVGFLFPLMLAPRREGAGLLHILGVPVLALGVFLLLWCVRDFYFAGRGTLAPWSPPRNLVRVGLYKWSRNPMYVGVATILAGWALWFTSVALLLYAVGVVVMFHLRVILGEEPWLARVHGAEWHKYTQDVPRWFR